MTSRNKQTGNHQAGFTLMEMMVVIVIMGLALAMLATSGPPQNRRLQTEAAARQVAEAMRAARGMAMAENTPVAFSLPAALPAWLKVSQQMPKGGLVFEPDGSATGGRVLLEGAGRKLAITANWLTGQIDLENL